MSCTVDRKLTPHASLRSAVHDERCEEEEDTVLSPKEFKT